MNEMIDSFDEKAEQLNKRKNLIIVIASILLFFCVCVIPIATFPAIINTERSGDTGKLWQNLVAYPVIISVLTFLLLLALFVCFRVKTVESRISSISGVFAGIISLAAYVIWQPSMDGVELWFVINCILLIAGIFFGALIMFVLISLINHPTIGFVTWTLTAISCVGLYSFYSNANIRDSVLNMCFGIALGMFAFIISRAQSARKLIEI